jgi:16S rRNA C1402 (ribose-2'-O) methylase RsmI
MTKLHEEYLRGTAAEIRDILAARPVQLGEFSVYVSGKKVKFEAVDADIICRIKKK